MRRNRTVDVPEWLSGMTRNHVGSARAGSNPAVHVFIFTLESKEGRKGFGKDGASVMDPLANYRGLSLFPQASFTPSKPCNAEEDLRTIHTHLTSMALRSSDKLLQQAKSIVDGNPELFNPSQSTNFPEEDNEFRRPQRPGLGLKRPRFSFKPTKKQSVETLLPTLDLDRLKDPAEFFAAHERLENAKKEIQKQLDAASFESDPDNKAARPRQRRPGLLGNNQLSITYKHRYPRETPDDVLSYQDTLGSQILVPAAENTDKAGARMASSEDAVMDSSATEANKLIDLLDGLLRCNSEDLEGDSAITHLQEKLQIKPIALEKFSVPDFPDNQVVDLKSLQGNKSKPKKPLSEVHNLMKGIDMNKKTPLRKSVQCPVQQLASPTPPRSPFTLLSSLKQHILRSRLSMNPFSAHEIDHLSGKNYSPTHMTSTVLETDRNCNNSSEIPREDNSRKSPNKLNLSSIEDIVGVGGTSLAEDTVRNGTSTSQKSVEDDSTEPDVNIVSNEPHVDMDIDVGGSALGGRVVDGHEDGPGIKAHVMEDDIFVGGTSLAEDIVRNATGTSQKCVEDNSMEPRINANTDSNEPHVDMDVDVGGSGLGEKVMDGTEDESNFGAHVMEDDIAVGKPSTVLNIKEAESCLSTDNADNMQKFSASSPTNPLADQLKHAGYQRNAMNKCTRRSDDDPEHCLQEKKDDSMVRVNRQKKVKSRVQKVFKDKELSKGKSLAAAGTSWTSGLRRSTRNRTRPLEYWKGERQVYGRIHESLVTVIGVKCMSPGSDGKPIMKAKSYVSDEHKELFELASLY
ncbi:hypothetical protein VNO78_10847 [Psophocarpus tetragonolobus]|uniref:Centromere protein C n=1 Tax=Psophocarpus tetragonolobus TaxID=3891 RepID=A0AAN9SMU5_PSOTE